jgi:hypothetical protein
MSTLCAGAGEVSNLKPTSRNRKGWRLGLGFQPGTAHLRPALTGRPASQSRFARSGVGAASTAWVFGAPSGLAARGRGR